MTCTKTRQKSSIKIGSRYSHHVPATNPVVRSHRVQDPALGQQPGEGLQKKSSFGQSLAKTFRQEGRKDQHHSPTVVYRAQVPFGWALWPQQVMQLCTESVSVKRLQSLLVYEISNISFYAKQSHRFNLHLILDPSADLLCRICFLQLLNLFFLPSLPNWQTIFS